VWLWAGFLLTLIAFVSYFALFYRFAETRDVPWANYILFGGAACCFQIGLKRAFLHPELHRGKIFGSVLAGLSTVVLGFFLAAIFYFSRQLPTSTGAPKVGQKAPEFTALDSSGNPVTLASLLKSPATFGGPASPPKSVLLIFYRGVW
ncbi:MAG: hypothetical protein ACREUU_21295, partial [Gammaproteobacteria bacterium]